MSNEHRVNPGNFQNELRRNNGEFQNKQRRSSDKFPVEPLVNNTKLQVEPRANREKFSEMTGRGGLKSHVLTFRVEKRTFRADSPARRGKYATLNVES